MKKTLITLLALSGMLSMSAYATETTSLKLSDATLTSSNGAEMNMDAAGMAANKEFTLTMSINANKLMELLSTSAPTETNTWIAEIDTERSGGRTDYSTGLAVVYASSSNETDASLMAGYYNDGNKLVGKNFNVTNGTTTTSYLSSIVSSAWGYNSTTKTSDIKAAAVTISGTVGSNFSICLTMKKSDGSLLEYTGTTSGYSFGNTTDINSVSFNSSVVNSAYYFDSIATTANAKSLNAALVPEPTTATLSLLALAGLAARRRRK